MAATAPTIDLSHLTDEEKRLILSVVSRDEEFEKAERERIRKLRTDLAKKERTGYVNPGDRRGFFARTGDWFTRRYRSAKAASVIVRSAISFSKKSEKNSGAVVETKEESRERPDVVPTATESDEGGVDDTDVTSSGGGDVVVPAVTIGASSSSESVRRVEQSVDSSRNSSPPVRRARRQTSDSSSLSSTSMSPSPNTKRRKLPQIPIQVKNDSDDALGFERSHPRLKRTPSPNPAAAAMQAKEELKPKDSLFERITRMDSGPVMGEDQAEADGGGGGGRADGRQTGKKVTENFASQLAMFEKLGSMQNRRIFLRDMNDDDGGGGGGGGDVEEPSFRNRHSSSENETKERRSEPTNTASSHDSTSSSDSDSQKRRSPSREETTKEEKRTLYEISLLKEERESENDDDEEESLHSAIFPQATLQSAIPVSTSERHRADELTRRRSSGFLLRSRRVDVSDDDYEKSERQQERESSRSIERSSPPTEIDGKTAATDAQPQVQMLEKIAVVSKTTSTSSSSGSSESMKETAEKKKKAQHDSGEWLTDNEDVSYVLDDEEEEETDIFFVDKDDKDAVSSPTPPPPGPIPPKERLQIVFEASADSSDVDEGTIAAASSESLEIARHDAAQLSALLGGSRKKKKTDGSLKGRPSPSVPPPPPPPVTVTEASPQTQQRRQPALPSSTELQDRTRTDSIGSYSQQSPRIFVAPDDFHSEVVESVPEKKSIAESVIRSPSIDSSIKSGGYLTPFRGGLSKRDSKESLALSTYSLAGRGTRVDVTGDVRFGLRYNHLTGTLEINVIEARQIAAVGSGGRTDPYVKTYLLPDKSNKGKRKTQVLKRTLNPVFNRTLEYKLGKEELKGRTLSLSVWDWDRFGHNSFLGEVRMDMTSQDLTSGIPSWYPLQDRLTVEDGGFNRGDLLLALRYCPPDSEEVKKKKKKESSGQLQILVKRARGLFSADSNGLSDPFVKCYLLPDKSKSTKRKTKTVFKSLNPVWEEVLVVKNVTLESLHRRVLEVTVWDYDRATSNDFIGGIRLGLSADEFGSGGHKIESWMDAEGNEVTHWKEMLASPNNYIGKWHKLRPTMDSRI